MASHSSETPNNIRRTVVFTRKLSVTYPDLFQYHVQFVHRDKKLITEEPPPVPETRTLPIPRFNPVQLHGYQAGKSYWYDTDEKHCISWDGGNYISDNVSIYMKGIKYLIEPKTTNFEKSVVAACINSVGEVIVVVRKLEVESDGWVANYYLYKYDKEMSSQIYSTKFYTDRSSENIVEIGSFTSDCLTLVYYLRRNDSNYGSPRKFVFNTEYTATTMLSIELEGTHHCNGLWYTKDFVQLAYVVEGDIIYGDPSYIQTQFFIREITADSDGVPLEIRFDGEEGSNKILLLKTDEYEVKIDVSGVYFFTYLVKLNGVAIDSGSCTTPPYASWEFSAFDGTLLVFAFSTKSYIINVKTNDTQIIDYNIVFGGSAGFNPLSVTL